MNTYLKISFVVLMSVFTLSSFDINGSFLPTSLKITVLDELGNPVVGASVVLFTKEEDYRAEINPVRDPLLTNEKGQVKFKNLEPIQYYLLATYEKKTNIGAGVLTGVLLEGKTNKVNTIIE